MALILVLLVHPALAALETAAVQLKQLPREFRLDGVVEAINRTTVSAQTSGQVQEILYDVDDFVEKDSVLIVLKDTEHQARVTQAAAELKAASAQLEETRDEFKRNKELFEKSLVSEAAMDKSRAALKSAKAGLDAAGAGLAQAKEQLEYTRIRAPYSGIVTERFVQIGEVAQTGQKVMSGISLEQLRVNVDVPQSIVPSVREFGSARIERPDGLAIVASRLTIFPIADAASNTFKVRVELPDGTDGLFPGMYVKVSFLTGMKQELVIPNASVVFRSEVTATYVVDDAGQVSFRHIRVGRRTDSGEVRVLAGISPGERVALDPIAAGVQLKAQRAERAHD